MGMGSGFGASARAALEMLRINKARTGNTCISRLRIGAQSSGPASPRKPDRAGRIDSARCPMLEPRHARRLAPQQRRLYDAAEMRRSQRPRSVADLVVETFDPGRYRSRGLRGKRHDRQLGGDALGGRSLFRPMRPTRTMSAPSSPARSARSWRNRSRSAAWRRRTGSPPRWRACPPCAPGAFWSMAPRPRRRRPTTSPWRSRRRWPLAPATTARRAAACFISTTFSNVAARRRCSTSAAARACSRLAPPSPCTTKSPPATSTPRR